MAWDFDGSSGVSVDNSATTITLPNGDWTLGGWFRYDNYPENGFPRLFQFGTSGNPSVRIFMVGTLEPFANARHLTAIVDDGSTAETIVEVDVNLDEYTGEWLFCAVSHLESLDRHQIRLYIPSERFLHNEFEDRAVGAITSPGNLHFGETPNNTQRFTGQLANWFINHHYFNNDEVFSAARDGRMWRKPNSHLFVPMVEGQYSEWTQQRTVTNNGASGASHPNISVYMPHKPAWHTVEATDFQPVQTTGGSTETQTKMRTPFETRREGVGTSPSLIRSTQNQLSLTQVADLVKSTSFTASSNLSLSEQADRSVILGVTCTSTLTVTDECGVEFATLRRAESSISLTHGATRNTVLGLTAGNNIIVSQQVSGVAETELTANNTVSFTQVCGLVKSVSKNTESNLNLGQQVFGDTEIPVTAQSLLSILHTCELIKDSHRTTDTPIAFTQECDGVVVKNRTAGNTLVFVQSLSKTIASTLTCSSTLTLTTQTQRNQNFTRTVDNVLSVSGVSERCHVQHVSASNSLSLTQDLVSTACFARTVSASLAITQSTQVELLSLFYSSLTGPEYDELTNEQYDDLRLEP